MNQRYYIQVKRADTGKAEAGTEPFRKYSDSEKKIMMIVKQTKTLEMKGGSFVIIR